MAPAWPLPPPLADALSPRADSPLSRSRGGAVMGPSAPAHGDGSVGRPDDARRGPMRPSAAPSLASAAWIAEAATLSEASARSPAGSEAFKRRKREIFN